MNTFADVLLIIILLSKVIPGITSATEKNLIKKKLRNVAAKNDDGIKHSGDHTQSGAFNDRLNSRNLAEASSILSRDQSNLTKYTKGPSRQTNPSGTSISSELNSPDPAIIPKPRCIKRSLPKNVVSIQTLLKISSTAAEKKLKEKETKLKQNENEIRRIEQNENERFKNETKFDQNGAHLGSYSHPFDYLQNISPQSNHRSNNSSVTLTNDSRSSVNYSASNEQSGGKSRPISFSSESELTSRERSLSEITGTTNTNNSNVYYGSKKLIGSNNYFRRPSRNITLPRQIKKSKSTTFQPHPNKPDVFLPVGDKSDAFKPVRKKSSHFKRNTFNENHVGYISQPEGELTREIQRASTPPRKGNKNKFRKKLNKNLGEKRLSPKKKDNKDGLNKWNENKLSINATVSINKDDCGSNNNAILKNKAKSKMKSSGQKASNENQNIYSFPYVVTSSANTDDFGSAGYNYNIKSFEPGKANEPLSNSSKGYSVVPNASDTSVNNVPDESDLIANKNKEKGVIFISPTNDGTEFNSVGYTSTNTDDENRKLTLNGGDLPLSTSNFQTKEYKIANELTSSHEKSRNLKRFDLIDDASNFTIEEQFYAKISEYFNNQRRTLSPPTPFDDLNELHLAGYDISGLKPAELKKLNERTPKDKYVDDTSSGRFSSIGIVSDFTTNENSDNRRANRRKTFSSASKSCNDDLGYSSAGNLMLTNTEDENTGYSSANILLSNKNRRFKERNFDYNFTSSGGGGFSSIGIATNSTTTDNLNDDSSCDPGNSISKPATTGRKKTSAPTLNKAKRNGRKNKITDKTEVSPSKEKTVGTRMTSDNSTNKNKKKKNPDANKINGKEKIIPKMNEIVIENTEIPSDAGKPIKNISSNDIKNYISSDKRNLNSEYEIADDRKVIHLRNKPAVDDTSFVKKTNRTTLRNVENKDTKKTKNKSSLPRRTPALDKLEIQSSDVSTVGGAKSDNSKSRQPLPNEKFDTSELKDPSKEYPGRELNRKKQHRKIFNKFQGNPDAE